MAKQKTVMLADGDIYAYNAAAMSEAEHWWDEDTVSLVSNFKDAKRIALSNLKAHMKEIKADEVIFFWSCPSRHYWRHDIMPTYKGGRKVLGARPPLALHELKVYLSSQFESHMCAHMEADDLLGIYGTNPNYKPDCKKVVVSVDKDMKTLPVWIFNPDKDYQPWKQTLEDADHFHLMQAIGGDTTDGYSGAVGMSVDSASAFLKDPWYWEQYEHTFKSGARKGLTELRWKKEDPRSTWENIVQLYVKAGQTEEDALLNAQVARILRYEDFNPFTGRPILWTPDKLT